jgi:hypothetical protein
MSHCNCNLGFDLRFRCSPDDEAFKYCPIKLDSILWDIVENQNFESPEFLNAEFWRKPIEEQVVIIKSRAMNPCYGIDEISADVIVGSFRSNPSHMYNMWRQENGGEESSQETTESSYQDSSQQESSQQDSQPSQSTVDTFPSLLSAEDNDADMCPCCLRKITLVLAPCRHKICFQCVLNIVKRENGRNEYKCIECRHIHKSNRPVGLAPPIVIQQMPPPPPPLDLETGLAILNGLSQDQQDIVDDIRVALFGTTINDEA